MATIKDLLNSIGPDELEKMDDATLRKHFEPYIRVGVVVKEEDVEQQTTMDISLEDTEGEKAKKKQVKMRKAVDLMDEIRKLALLHGVDAGIPTKIR